MRVLCTGDIHIGRRVSRLPRQLHAEQFSSASAWLAVVDLAVRERVDLVAISGDIVDRQNRYFEAIGPFESGLRQLTAAGIETVAVSGNHDFDVLPQLARGLSDVRFRLLGAGGHWERYTVEQDGQPVLHIDGWSFPAEHVGINPLDSYPAHSDDGVPVLGLLHADLDQPASRYAPVALAELRNTPASAWLLGHIHHPRLIAEPNQPLVLYPGSPLAMDPGERGVHGPWLLELRLGHPAQCRQRPTSRIRFEPLEVRLDGIDDPDDLRHHIRLAVQERLADIAAVGGELVCVAFRLTLTGRTSLHLNLLAHVRELEEDFQPRSGDIVGYVERVIDETRPSLDLKRLAERNDPPGELCRVLLALEAGDPDGVYRQLLLDTRRRLDEVWRHRTYAAIAADEPPDLELARRHLLHEGYRLLDALVAQREQAVA